MVAALNRAEALRRTFVASFLALGDLAKSSPADAAEIESALVSHVRAAFPMRLMDTGPVAKMTPDEIEPATDTAEIEKLRAEIEVLRPVFVAALAWCEAGGNLCGQPDCNCTECKLWRAIDAIDAIDAVEAP